MAVAGGVLVRLKDAREALILKDRARAMSIYEEVLAVAGDRADVLVTISGDLGANGHTREIIEFIAPRYDAQLALDRPLYQPGDTVRYRSLVLSRFGLAADRDVPVRFEIKDPAGAVVAGSPHASTSQRGVADGEFSVPAQLAGGQYTLVARAADNSFSEQKRTFFVRSYRVPRLKKELEFLRDSYGPGQTVAADFKAQRAEGGAAAGAKLHLVATIDGQKTFEKDTQTSDAGTFHVEFTAKPTKL